MPGYINGDFKMNLGSLTNNYGSFALYFDIVNTIDEETQESFYYSPSVTCEQDGVSVKTSGAIDIGTVLPENVATADISGTIKLTVINPTETSVDLSKITITISQAEVYTDFVFDDHGTLTAYLGSDSNVTIPSTYSMVGEPELVTLEVNEGEDPFDHLTTLLRITDFTFNANGIKTYIMDELRPVPELSFAIRELGATAGIMITASHNTAQYNGYKVYWDDGAQIVSPRDKDIIAEEVHRQVERAFLQVDVGPCHRLVDGRHPAEVVRLHHCSGISCRIRRILQFDLVAHHLADAVDSDHQQIDRHHEGERDRQRRSPGVGGQLPAERFACSVHSRLLLNL